jgi:hypothetical protein
VPVVRLPSSEVRSASNDSAFRFGPIELPRKCEAPRAEVREFICRVAGGGVMDAAQRLRQPSLGIVQSAARGAWLDRHDLAQRHGAANFVQSNSRRGRKDASDLQGNPAEEFTGIHNACRPIGWIRKIPFIAGDEKIRLSRLRTLQKFRVCRIG